MRNKYLIKIVGKNPKRFLKNLHKMNIQMLSIQEEANTLYLLLLEEDYERLLRLPTIYEITLIRTYGPIHWKQIFHEKKYFFLTIVFAICIFYFLSHLIFDVEVVHNKQEIRTLVMTELKNYGIDRFHFCVSYERKEEIVSEILNKHKEELEWMEIERVGTKYIVRVEERIKNGASSSQPVRNIVAKKDGIIRHIEASQGEIVVKRNDYVKKGDILISGEIHKGEDVKNTVSATGKVLAETWYKVTVEMPYTYHEEKVTGRKKQVLQLRFLNHTFSFFDFTDYIGEKKETTPLLSHPLLPLALEWNTIEEVEIIDEVYSKEEALRKAREKAFEKIKLQLGENDSVIDQKDLKITENHSKIIVEVFFKVEEDITDYQPIPERQEESE